MTWRQARRIARTGRRVRYVLWPASWSLVYASGGGSARTVPVLDRAGKSEVMRAPRFTAEQFRGEWALATAYVPPPVVEPLGMVQLTDARSAAVLTFGDFPVGEYRVEYIRGATYYIGGRKDYLLINDRAASPNGYRILLGSIVPLSPGATELDAPGDSVRFAIGDPRPELELLEAIEERNRGASVRFQHPGGPISMYFSDIYTDNAASAIPPEFALYAAPESGAADFS